MFVREEALAQEDQKSSSANKIVVGSVEWKKLKEKERAEGQNNEDERKPRIPAKEVNGKMFSGQWVVIEDGLHGFNQADNDVSYDLIDYSTLPRQTARIGGHSILASSHFLPNEANAASGNRRKSKAPLNSGGDNIVTAEVTGVAYSALTIEKRTPDGLSSINVICEGVTLFPPGKIWIARALLCINRVLFPDFRRVIELSNGSEFVTTAGEEEEDLQDVSNIDLCGQIGDYLADMKINEIAPSTELMSLVDALFLDFL